MINYNKLKEYQGPYTSYKSWSRYIRKCAYEEQYSMWQLQIKECIYLEYNYIYLVWLFINSKLFGIVKTNSHEWSLRHLRLKVFYCYNSTCVGFYKY